MKIAALMSFMVVDVSLCSLFVVLFVLLFALVDFVGCLLARICFSANESCIEQKPLFSSSCCSLGDMCSTMMI